MTEQPLASRDGMAAGITYEPIGIIHTPYGPDTVCPHQPLIPPRGEARLVIEPRWADGLYRLDSFSHVVVLFHMGRQDRDAATRVEPPWADGIEVGVFASRTPARPNPIGLSIVKLLRIEGNTVFTSALDAYDGTPLLDIKPYVGLLDARPDAGNGWLDKLADREHAIDHLLGRSHHHHHHEHE